MIGFKPERVEAQIATYAPYEKLMTAEGFSRKIAENILTIAGLDVWEAFQLFRQAKRVPAGGTILDIGTKWGGSLISMYYGAESISRRMNFIGIEPAISSKLLDNIESLSVGSIEGFSIKIIEATSGEAAVKITPDSIDLIFIDANHKYPYIRADITNYWPKLRREGVMLGHDYRENGKKFRGVRQAVREIFGQNFTVLEHTHIFKAQKEERRNKV